MSDITLFGIALVKIILDFQPSSVDPSWIRNLLYPFNPIFAATGILSWLLADCGQSPLTAGIQQQNWDSPGSCWAATCSYQVCLVFRRNLTILLLGRFHSESVHKDRAGSHTMKSIIIKTDWNDVLVGTGTVCEQVFIIMIYKLYLFPFLSTNSLCVICYKVPGRRIRSCYRVKARTVYGGRNCCSHAFSSAVAVLPPW